MNQTLRTICLLITAVWVGGLVWVGLVFAPYLFGLAGRKSELVPHTGVAAELIGPLLSGADLVGMNAAAGVALILITLRARRCLAWGARYYVPEILLLVAGLCAAINFFGFSPAVNRVQEQLRAAYGGFHLADRGDPLYADFTFLHQASTIVFLVGFLAAVAVLVCLSRFHQPPAPR